MVQSVRGVGVMVIVGSNNLLVFRGSSDFSLFEGGVLSSTNRRLANTNVEEVRSLL